MACWATIDSVDQPSHFSAVLFDMNGVLVDDEKLHEQAFREVLAAQGISLSAQDYARNFMGRTDRDGFRTFLGPEVAGISLLIEQKGQAYQRLATGSLIPYPGIIDFVSSVAADQIPMAIVTSSTRGEAEAVIEALDISEHFPVVIAAEDVERGKPDPQGYLLGASELKTQPNRCLVIEDAPSGIEAAKRAGMSVLAITNTHPAAELLSADLVVGAVDSRSWPVII